MIYTCYEMMQDCRAGKPEGWTYFLKQYVPLIRRFVAHYFPGRAADPVITELCKPASGLFQSREPAPERAFVADLRQYVLNAAQADQSSLQPETTIDTDTLTVALEPLTLTEKLVIWFETMRYADDDTGRILRMSPATARKIRDRGADLIRGHADSWSHTLLADNGLSLGHAATATASDACPASKVFLDVIDGRATWQGREHMSRHVSGCWHCLDHYCRLLEVVDSLRAVQPLDEAEVGSYQHVLGIQPRQRSLWRRG